MLRRGLVVLAIAAPRLALAASFNGLGIPDWAIETHATDVSADGSVVAGYVTGPAGARLQGFRWTTDGGMTLLGDLDQDAFLYSRAAISADGSVIVGTADSQPATKRSGG
jgi:probable HAF family extracellular repeat protein